MKRRGLVSIQQCLVDYIDRLEKQAKDQESRDQQRKAKALSQLQEGKCS